MELGPGQDEPKLPRLHCAFDHLDLVDPDLGLAAGIAGMEMRKPVIVEVHRIEIPKKRLIVGTWAMLARDPVGSITLGPATVPASARMQGPAKPKPRPAVRQ
jgi:hypothetical protein